MPSLIPAVALIGPSPAVTIMLVLGVVLAMVYVVILVRLYRPRRLDEGIRTRRAVSGDGSAAAAGGSGAAYSNGGFNNGGFDSGGCDGGGGGGGGDC